MAVPQPSPAILYVNHFRASPQFNHKSLKLHPLRSPFVLLGWVFFFRPHPWPMEVPRLGVKLELQLTAYTPATAMWDPSCVCDLHHSSRQCWILNLLSGARDQTHILMDAIPVGNPLSHKGKFFFFCLFVFSRAVPRLGVQLEL